MVESDSISACICTSDWCTGYVDEPNRQSSSSFSSQTQAPRRTVTQAPRHERTLAPRNVQTPAPRIDQFSSRYTTQPSTSFRRNSPTEPSFERKPQNNARSQFQDSSSRVKCHQCGRLFSRDGNSACTEFDEYDSSQQGYCKEGEACLWYSWQKSRSTTAYVRECFSKSIVLGTVDDPLIAKPYCDPLDISENSISRVTACLCETDLCNSFRSGGEKRPSKVNQQSSAPKRKNTPSSTSNKRQQESESPSQRNQEIEETPRSPKLAQRPSAKQVVHPDKPGLQCFSCGSLLNTDAQCETFSRTNISQTQTCLKGESCLMYTWRKSSTETATLRECFPTSVLLGTLNNPLTPSDQCFERDITDDGSGSIKACLCNTDYCNDSDDEVYSENEIFSGDDEKRQETISSPSRNQITTTRTPKQTTRQTIPSRSNNRFTTTLRSFTQRTTTEQPRSCPPDFEPVSNNCYFISSERVGWIEAKKKCELKRSRLASLEHEDKEEDLLEFVSSSTRRRVSKYWVGGNDIRKEGVWEWEGTNNLVPDFGWSEDPYNSAEENCLSWSVSFGFNIGDSDSSWQGASCCNSQRYICQL